MTRRHGPTPADDLGADLDSVWDRLADHAAGAPDASPQLRGRVQGALLSELDRTLRPTAHRPIAVVRPLVRPSSLRSLVAAALIVALLGAGVALAGAGVARLNQLPVDQPTPAVEDSDDPADTHGDADGPVPVVQPPVPPEPADDEDDVDDPDADGDDRDGDEDGSETDDPEDEDGPADDEDAGETPEPDDHGEDESPDPDNDPDEDRYDRDRDEDDPEDEDPN